MATKKTATAKTASMKARYSTRQSHPHARSRRRSCRPVAEAEAGAEAEDAGRRAPDRDFIDGWVTCE